MDVFQHCSLQHHIQLAYTLKPAADPGSWLLLPAAAACNHNLQPYIVEACKLAMQNADKTSLATCGIPVHAHSIVGRAIYVPDGAVAVLDAPLPHLLRDLWYILMALAYTSC
jgi:hypothetical protein